MILIYVAFLTDILYYIFSQENRSDFTITNQLHIDKSNKNEYISCMTNVILLCLTIPFLGTTLGATGVFFMKRELNANIFKILLGFASGVMVAASIWSLLIPAIDTSEHLGKFSFVPVFIGFWLGNLFLLGLDSLIPHLHPLSENTEGLKSDFKRLTMLVLAITLHNIPEGMAVGAILAGYIQGGDAHIISEQAALTLSIGIALQNFPEGSIVSMPLKSESKSKSKAFLVGAFSGIVEPIAALITIFASSLIIPALPYFLSFAAGAMMYVVVEELLPEMSEGKHNNLGVISFAFGFSLMMVLDVALG